MSGDGDREDQDLLARMRGTDPAAGLPSVHPDRIARMLEDAMSPDTPTRQTSVRGRTRAAWLAAAAAVVVIAGVGAVALLGQDDEPTPTAQEPRPTVTELTMPPGSPGRCMVPDANTLATATYAFDGEVSAIEDGVVTLTVSQWYAGGPTDRVQVAQSSADRSALIGAPRFAVGERYLVAGTEDHDVMVCGFSGPYDADLARLYDRAFPE